MKNILTFIVLFATPLTWAKSYNFGLTTTYATFSSKAITVDSMEYDIDPKMLTSLEGSFKVTKKLRGLLNVNFDSTEVNRTFQILGLLATKDMLLQVTSGKISGTATLDSTLTSNPVSFREDFENKYLAADILFRIKSKGLQETFGCTDDSGNCYHGIRLIKYQVPVELLISSRFGASNSEDAPFLLDPEFDVFGVMYTFSINQLRNFTMEDSDAPNESRFATVTTTSVGYAKGSASDRAKTNLNTLEAGTTFEDDSQGMITFDSSLAIYYTWKWTKKTSRWLVAAGYMAQLNLALNPEITTDEDAPSNPDLARIDSASPGYLLHGPSFALFAVF